MASEARGVPRQSPDMPATRAQTCVAQDSCSTHTYDPAAPTHAAQTCHEGSIRPRGLGECMGMQTTRPGGQPSRLHFLSGPLVPDLLDTTNLTLIPDAGASSGASLVSSPPWT